MHVTKTLSDDREVLPPENGKPRTIVLAPQAADALRRRPRPLDASALIFTAPNGFSRSTWHYHWPGAPMA